MANKTFTNTSNNLNDTQRAMHSHTYRLIVMFYKDSEYMFEFDYDDLAALFRANPSKSGFHTIKSGLVFKIKGRLYEVGSLMFNFFTVSTARHGFDARLIVNTREVPEVIEPHVEVPDEVLDKKAKDKAAKRE